MLDEVEYMTADREDKFIVAQANEPIGEDGRFLNAQSRRPPPRGDYGNRPRARRLHGYFAQDGRFGIFCLADFRI